MRIRHLSTILLPLVGLFFALPTRAQGQQPSPAPAATSDTSGTSSQPTSKKVWTNDDFGSNPAAAPATKPTKEPKPKAAKTNPVSGKNANWYRAQILKMNGQIAGIDHQVASYQAALNGEPPPNQGVQEYHMHRGDWQAEIQKLTQQKQDLLAKISALEDEARHNGVEENQLH